MRGHQLRFFTGLSALFLVACTTSSKTPQMPDTLVEAAQTMDAHMPETCDALARDARRDLAKAFDDADTELTALSSTLTTSHYKRVAMGPIEVRELIAPLPNKGVHVEVGQSWQEMDSAFQSLPQAKNEAWISLDSQVRSTMMNDWRRLMYRSLEANEVDPATSPDEGFRMTGAVTVQDGALHVALDPGPFAGAEDQLADYIESVWVSQDMHVKVDWVSATFHPEAFTFELGEGEGGRSHVSWSSRTVTLEPDVTENAIAHEIGHVLGFADRYYTTYDTQSCRYSVVKDDSDIMSQSSTGAVTDAEWAVLASKYPM
jgi:hypothetical protein